MILELTKGAALLLSLCYLETFIRRYLHRNPTYQGVSLGILYGTICVVGMLAPIHFSEGVILDARSVVIAIAALFGGPLCSLVAAAIAATYRLWLGGAGTLIGVTTIFVSLALGLLYRYGRGRFGWGVGASNLFLFGFLLHLVCIASFVMLPTAAAVNFFQNVAFPIIVVFTPATVLLGWMVRDIRIQLDTAENLKATSDALGESERRFRAIFDHSPNGITLKDENGTYLIVNKAFARWQNLEPHEIIGKSLADLHAAGQVAEINRVDQQVAFEGRFVSGKGIREYADGVIRDVNVTKLPVTLKDGCKKATLTILTDITEITRTEKELRRAYDDAVAANRSKSDFLARMSHEFRTPLNAILGFSDVLRNQYMGDATTERAQEYANDIHVSADLLLELVNDLLDISAIESGRIQVDQEAIDVRVVLDECLRTLKYRLDSKRITTDLLIPDNARPLLADRRSLKQIVLNLLTNAIKFTQEGGNIKLGLKQSGNMTAIVVADNGKGIEAELLHNLMSPDTVFASNSHVSQEGWGLGLPIVRGLAEMHGGRINIESYAQQGTTVEVMFPNELQGHAL